LHELVRGRSLPVLAAMEAAEESLEPTARAVQNVLDDEHAVDGLMKTLISSKALSSAWHRLGLRLQVAEGGVQKALHSLERLPQDFVPRSECLRLLGAQGDQLVSHTSRISKLDRLVEGLRRALSEDTRKELDAVAARVSQVEGFQGRLTAMCDAMEKNFEERHRQMVDMVSDFRGGVERALEGGVVTCPRLEASLSALEQRLRQETTDLGVTLRDFAHATTDRMLIDLTSLTDDAAAGQQSPRHWSATKAASGRKAEPSASSAVSDVAGAQPRPARNEEASEEPVVAASQPGPARNEGASEEPVAAASQPGPARDEEASEEPVAAAPQPGPAENEEASDELAAATPHRKRLLRLIGAELVQPLRLEVGGLATRLGDLTCWSAKLKEDTVEQIQRVQRKGTETSNRLDETTELLRAEINVKATKDFVAMLDKESRESKDHLAIRLTALQDNVIRKLTDVAAHFSKVQEVIEDHEHVIRHQVEEIENRATKYDLLLCRTQLDRCALKDERKREIDELKKAVEMHGNRIDIFAAARSSRAARDISRRWLRSARASQATSRTTSRANSRANSRATSRANSRANSRDSDLDVAGQTGDLATQAKASEGGDSGVSEHSLQERLSLGQVQNTNASTYSSGPEASSLQGGSDEELSDENVRNPHNLRLQLEVAAMGLVGLASFLLRGPKLGESRAERQYHGRQLLQELDSLRQWISSGVAPSGWTPDRLATLALSFMKGFDTRPSPRWPQSTSSVSDLIDAQAPSDLEAAAQTASARQPATTSEQDCIPTPRPANDAARAPCAARRESAPEPGVGGSDGGGKKPAPPPPSNTAAPGPCAHRPQSVPEIGGGKKLAQPPSVSPRFPKKNSARAAAKNLPPLRIAGHGAQ